MKKTVVLVCACLATTTAAQELVHVIGEQKVSDTQGGLQEQLDSNDLFGTGVARIGDLDGDGTVEVAVSARLDDDAGNGAGAVYVLSLDSTGHVVGEQKITEGVGGFTGDLDTYDVFGSAVEAIGDVDGNGVADICVGAFWDDDGGVDRGAVYVLFLLPDGTVRSHQKISSTAGGFAGDLLDGGEFGQSIASVGDLDGDGFVDLAVSARNSSRTGVGRGELWILFLLPDGTVKSEALIAEGIGGFQGPLFDGDQFGSSLGFLGDRKGDGTVELACGAVFVDDGASDSGAVFFLSLDEDGEVQQESKISAASDALSGQLMAGDQFGSAISLLQDLDGDGLKEIVVTAVKDDSGGTEHGAAWFLSLDAQSAIVTAQRVHDGTAGFVGPLYDSSSFGYDLARLGDLDGNGYEDLLVGVPNDSDGGQWHGAIFSLLLGPAATTSSHNGAGVNAIILEAVTDPILGQAWTTDLDCTGHAPSFATLEVYHRGGSGFFLPGGELLLDLTSGQVTRTAQIHFGSVVRFSLNIPADLSLAGFTASAQAVVLGSPGYELSNALHLRAGY